MLNIRGKSGLTQSNKSAITKMGWIRKKNRSNFSLVRSDNEKKIWIHRNKLAYVLFSRADHRAGFSSRTNDEGRFGENSRSFLPSDDADDESVAKTLPRRSQIASSRKTSGQAD